MWRLILSQVQRRLSRSVPFSSRHCGSWLAIALLGSGLLPGPRDALADDVPGRSEVAVGPQTLSDIGMRFEWALHGPPEERTPALVEISGDLRALLDAGLAKEQRSTAHLLHGEIRYAMRDFDVAAREFEQAARKDDSDLFADAAALARVAALEAAGRDDDAARAWIDWEKKYPESALMAEARLRRAWNGLRRGAPAEASRTLDELQERFPWMEGDARVRLAVATIAYLQDRPEEAVALLGDDFDGAAATYLRALCYTAIASPLKAAAMYQEVVERYPASSLRDIAMLAKADIFMASGAYRSAAEEFERVAAAAADPVIRSEAELRQGAALHLDGDAGAAIPRLRQVVDNHGGSDQAARAQYLLGEVLAGQALHEEAIVEFNRVLTEYFEHSLAATAQYRVGRCLDALGRQADATSTYQTVVSGYSQAAEAPAAAFLAGAGLLEQERALVAAPFFQLVLDRYAVETDAAGLYAFTTPEHQELVEAATCLLMLAYHRAGDLGQLSGVPHLMLHKLPPSDSSWRAIALLIDADALASQGRHAEAQRVLEQLREEFPAGELSVPASRLLAWIYAQQGKVDLAMATEAEMIEGHADRIDVDQLGSAYLNRAHLLFNQQRYLDAAVAYEEYLRRFPGAEHQLLALYQAGLCYMRLDRQGDAVDRWESIVAGHPAADIAERTWIRAGDLYFRAAHYDDAKRCYLGLLEYFDGSEAVAGGMLRLAQCEYNAGDDAAALARFDDVIGRFPGTAESTEAERGVEMTLYRLGQREDGATVLASLVERYPHSAFAADAQFGVAMQSYEAEEYLEAAEAFRRVVSQFPGFADADRAHFLMAEAYELGGAEDDAYRAYEQFLLFFPDSELRTPVRFRIGAQRFDRGDYMRAAIDFTGVLEGETSSELRAAALFNLALCRRMLGELEPAREAFESYRQQGFSAESRAAEVAYQLGSLHEEAGRLEPAALEFEQALAAGPNEVLAIEIRYRLGSCKEQLGDLVGARRVYRHAIDAGDADDPFRLSALARCAALYEQDGDHRNAVEAYDDLARHAQDPELAAAARERLAQLETAVD